MVPSAAPVDRPVRMRPTNSRVTSEAAMNASIPAVSPTSAARRTGRRPIWSESRPLVSKVVRPAIAKTP